MKKIKNLFLKISISLSSFLTALPIHAQTGDSKPTLYDTVNSQAQTMQVQSGLTNVSLGLVISMIIKGALSLLALIFLIIMVFSGYRWMTASGNEESVTKSKDAIKRAIIGLVIIMMAYAITYFIFQKLPFSGSSSQPPAS